MSLPEDRPAFFRQNAAECARMARISTTSKVRDSYKELQRHGLEPAEHAERVVNRGKAED
jgi:hypothetical protein